MLTITVSVPLFVIMSITFLKRTHNWLGSLRRGKFWLLTILWSNCWEKYRVLLMVQKFDLQGWSFKLCWYCLGWGSFPFILLTYRLSSAILTSVIRARSLLFFITFCGCLPYQSFNLQTFYQLKINPFSSFPSYKFYFHLPIVIASGISIYFLIRYTRIDTFTQFYTSIRTVSHYLLSSLLYPNQNLNHVLSTYLQW